MEIPVKEIINVEMKLLGFKKKDLCWYKSYTDVVHVIELRKSKWGKFYHINLAVWVKKLGVNERPKSRECHLQAPLDRIHGCPVEIVPALNEEDYWKMDSENRKEIIKSALSNAELMFFGKLISFEQVKNFVKNKPIINLAVTKSLIEII